METRDGFSAAAAAARGGRPRRHRGRCRVLCMLLVSNLVYECDEYCHGDVEDAEEDDGGGGMKK